MLEAITLLTATWKCVLKETLVNCFKKVGISSVTQSQFDTSDVTEDDNRGEEEDVD